VLLHRRPESAELMGPRNATIRFPNRTFVQFALVEEPAVGMSIEAQGACWRITSMRLPWGLGRRRDMLCDVDVEPASGVLPSNG
jgi:hypothetical protein